MSDSTSEVDKELKLTVCSAVVHKRFVSDCVKLEESLTGYGDELDNGLPNS